jgi:hypothetical protein
MAHPMWKRAAILACSVAAAGACGGDVDDAGYTVDNRRAFLTACTESLQDSTLVRDVCECAYDEIRRSLPYNEFVELDDNLEVDSLAPVPNSVLDLVADCFVVEADL